MNLYNRPIVAGIPVPCELYDNYVSQPVTKVAKDSNASVAQVRRLTAEMNADGRAVLAIYKGVDGEERVSGYIFEDTPKL